VHWVAVPKAVRARRVNRWQWWRNANTRYGPSNPLGPQGPEQPPGPANAPLGDQATYTAKATSNI
jgi:hypothetical protein